MREIAVSMNRGAYLMLLEGRKAGENSPGIRGCGSKEAVIQYLNDLHLFLGHVVDITVED